jgi:glucokinase
LTLNFDTFPRLLGDIGGTNARFAWQGSAGSQISQVQSYPCTNFRTLEAAIKHYLSTQKFAQAIHCALGIANPITGDYVQMTNHHWSFSIAEMKKSLAFKRLLVINDFAALALSLPSLGKNDLVQIGQGNSVEGAPIALVGPGTGLGVSGLLMSGSAIHPISGEGGHVTLAASDDFDANIIGILQTKFGHASAERALSGPGLVNLYRAICELANLPALELASAQIITHAKEKSNPQCVQALQMFFSFLGNVAGNLALTLGARGGVYIGGGIVPRVLTELQESSFRQRFENKGRFQSYLSDIQTFVINSAVSPALIGASVALDQAQT